MSVVTNIILSFSIIDEDDEETTRDDARLVQINKFFNNRRGFMEIADDCIGGSKRLEHPTFIGAFNYFDLNGFIRHLETLKWVEPENVQVFVCEQEQDRYIQVYPPEGRRR